MTETYCIHCKYLRLTITSTNGSVSFICECDLKHPLDDGGGHDCPDYEPEADNGWQDLSE